MVEAPSQNVPSPDYWRRIRALDDFLYDDDRTGEGLAMQIGLSRPKLEWQDESKIVHWSGSARIMGKLMLSGSTLVVCETADAVEVQGSRLAPMAIFNYTTGRPYVPQLKVHHILAPVDHPRRSDLKAIRKATQQEDRMSLTAPETQDYETLETYLRRGIGWYEN